MTAQATRWRRSIAAMAAALLALAALLWLRNSLVDPALERLARSDSDGRAIYKGSWYFPRGGPYILGFESPGRARLVIDGRTVAAGPGRQLQRRVYEAGIRAVRFEVPVSAQDDSRLHHARLLWHPPGRRGPPEYVPPASLAPVPPERATFGRWVGAAPVDGAISGIAALVLAALWVYLGYGVFASRNPSGDSSGDPSGNSSGNSFGGLQVARRVAAWAGIVLVLAAVIRLIDLDGAGQTWDEDVNWSAGRNYIANWLALDFRPAAWEWNYEHPPVMKYIAGIGAQWADGYGPARALSGLVMALGCALLVPIGQRLFSLRVGVVAGIIAALSPHLIAHGKIVGHEAPTVLWWALGIWLALRLHDPDSGIRSPSGSPSGLSTSDRGPPVPACADAAAAATATRLPMRLAVLGAVVGLAVFSRFANALLGPMVGAIALITAAPGRRWRTVGLGLTIMLPVIAAVGFAIWPRLWSTPIDHLQAAWGRLNSLHAPEPFWGQITNTPPRYYFVAYLVATAPLGVLAAATLWLGRCWQRRRSESTACLVLAAWFAIPLLISLSPVRQDGVRYIMPCLLALAMAAAAGLDFVAMWIWARLGTRFASLTQRRIYAILGLVMAGYLAVVAARIHPYYLDYYGEHVGGPAVVAQRRWFEVAWWGEGIADAVDYINRHASPRARVFKRCVEPSHLTWLRADLWATEARRADEADWILIYQPAWRPCALPAQARLVYEVSAQGAPLVRVYRLNQ